MMDCGRFLVNMTNFWFLLCCLFNTSFAAADQPISGLEKPMVVVVVSYNNIEWCEANIVSILMQKYSNYRVIYVDDCSADGTGDAVKELFHSMGQDLRLTLIRNPQRLGSPLANHYQAITSHCKDEEIVICLDGDDWLAKETVLQTINEAYASDDIWVTHGTLIQYPSGVVGWSQPVPDEYVVRNAFREYRCPTHLKTFYAWLFKKIKLEDLQYEGNFFRATGDQAMMFPLIEMAAERHVFIEDVLYVYNMDNPLGESRVHTDLQNDFEAIIRSKVPYKRLIDKTDDP